LYKEKKDGGGGELSDRPFSRRGKLCKRQRTDEKMT
jgi:hypothetical protein